MWKYQDEMQLSDVHIEILKKLMKLCQQNNSVFTFTLKPVWLWLIKCFFS